MNPQDQDLEARMLHNTSKRLFEYNDLAYEKLRRLEGRTDEERKDIHAARLYVAAARSAAEVLYDLYASEQAPQDQTTGQPADPANYRRPEKPGWGRRILKGLVPGLSD